MTEPNPNPTPTPDPKPTPEPTPALTFTPEQEKEINGRIAAARRQAESEAKAKVENDAAVKAEAERVERERKEAEAKGEYETVRQSLESERDTIKGERDALTERVTKYEEALAPMLDAELKRFDALDDKTLMDGYPKDADALTKFQWLRDPWKQKAVKEVEDRQSTHADNLRRFPNTPRPNGTVTPTDDDAKRAQARMYREF